ncbi:MAG: energy-coupling factor transporter ATPase [bacterium]|nr:energy-coupling factor transporter ATPase [bacterium]
MKHAIEVQNLSFSYFGGGDVKVLDKINLLVNEGEFVVIMGETGAGKSTLCQCLNLLVPRFRKGRLTGKIRIFGEDIKNKRVYDLADKVGLVFQDFEYQLFSTNVELEVAFGPENLSIPKETINERVNDCLKKVDLIEFKGRSPTNLSGGEKQRLAIASILSIKPRILVMDEATTDLDPKGKLEIFKLAKILRDEGTTLIMVTHEIEEVLDADRIIIVKQGRIVLEDTPKHVLKRSSLLEENGIRPHQLTRLFQKIGSRSLPLTIDKALQRFKKDFILLDDRYKRLVNKDKERSYGKIVIEVNDLEYIYPEGQKALDGISLRIREGEFVALVGQNGSGKTTLAKHFNGLLKGSRGDVKCFGENIKGKKISELSRVIGYVFQNPDHQIFSNTVKDEIAFSLRNFGYTESEISTRVDEALEEVGLLGYEREDPFSLGKGERQRLAIASVLVTRPQILILDEPTTGLDYSEQKQIMKLLERLNKEGTTIIIITHNMWIVAEYTHRSIVIHEGKIILDGTTREVFSKEHILERSNLYPPDIVRLSNRLGKTLLSIEEFKYCTERR